ncbi:cytochrome bc1 complex diheme cytochrome c subunit [Actinomadura scrupuli]|uniref:cytochrome bc1 complex diheme cytochrome c subunit n=1 Tax=Actinomadura scrupuli TaxID=559629 RepID=UPI003D96C5B7
MKWFTAWRRRPWAGYAVVLVALAAIGVVYAGFSPRTDRAEAADSRAAARAQANGRQLFEQNCASCHGLNAEGTRDAKGNTIAPSLIGVGAASVDFQVGTGRMPAANPGAQMPRKEPVPAFNPKLNPKAQQNLTDLSNYIASLGGGPAIPTKEQASPDDSQVGLGGKLFRTNCAQCHNFAGEGGALTYGKYAPPLKDATDQQIYEAMITGPQAMPVFNDTTITPEQKRAIIAYVVQTRDEVNPGGNGLGRIGPVAEGLAGWLIGIGLLVFAAMWITAKKPKKLKKQHD